MAETTVKLETITTLHPTRILAAQQLARLTAEANGNKRGPDRQLVVITDSSAVIHKAGPIIMKDKDLESLGWTFRRSDKTYIWLSPTVYGPSSTLRLQHMRATKTLIHELAHAYTNTGHGWTWRRMYGHLLAMCGPVFDETFRLRTELTNTVARYQLTGYTERYISRTGDANSSGILASPEHRRDEEVDAHAQAIDRLVKRIDPLLHVGLDWR